MSREVKQTVYRFDELEEDVQAKVIESFRHALVDDSYWFEIIEEDAASVGVKILSYDGRTCEIELKEYPQDVANMILKDHGDSCDTYQTAKNFIECLDEEGNASEEDIREFRLQLAEDYRIMADREYEYMTSDECIDEWLCGTDREFLADGTDYNE